MTVKQLLTPMLNWIKEASTMEIKTIRIGAISKGIDGTDDYLLLRRLDDDMTTEQAIEYLLPLVYVAGSGPGGMYCHTVRAAQSQHSGNEVICIVEYRYDV